MKKPNLNLVIDFIKKLVALAKPLLISVIAVAKPLLVSAKTATLHLIKTKPLLVSVVAILGVSTMYLTSDDDSLHAVKELSPEVKEALTWKEVCRSDVSGNRHFCGFINKQNEITIPMIYRFSEHFSNVGFLDVLNEDRLEGVINTKGEEVIPFGKYSNIKLSHNYAIAAVKNKEKDNYSIIDLNSNSVIGEYDEIDSRGLDEGIISVNKNNKEILINTKGEEIISLSDQKWGLNGIKDGFIYVDVYGEPTMARVDLEGEENIPFGKYFRIVPLQYGFALGYYKEEDKLYQDVINPQGEVIVSNGKEAFFKNNFLIVINNQNENALFDIKGDELISFGDYDYIDGLVNNLFAVAKDDERGVIDSDENEIIPFGEYRVFTKVTDNLFEVFSATNQRAIFDNEGNEVIPFGKYDNFRNINGLIVARLKGTDKEVIMNEKMELLGEFSSVWGFGSELIGVYTENGRGLMNNDGKIIIEPQYSDVSEVSDNFNLFVVANETNFGDIRRYLDINNGNFYDDIGLYNKDGLIPVKKSDKWGVINTKGDVVVPFNYQDLKSFAEYGLAPAMKDGKWGMINTKGEEVIPFKYYSIEYPSFYEKLKDKLVLVKESKDDIYSRFMNMKGDIFSSELEFHNNFAVAKYNNKFGYLNEDGEMVIAIQYEKAQDFSDGLAAVAQDGKVGFINQEGKTVIPFEYENADSFVNDLAPVMKENKWGYINKKGEIVIPLQYSSATKFSNGYAKVIKDETEFVINEKGEIVKSY